VLEISAFCALHYGTQISIPQGQAPAVALSSRSLFADDRIFFLVEEAICLFVYYCEAVSEQQRAARCIVAPGVLLERGDPRDLESSAGGELGPVAEDRNLDRGVEDSDSGVEDRFLRRIAICYALCG
jgi:hypothetical protein